MRAKLLVGFVTARETEPCKDAAGVRSEHEHRAVKRVKQEVVRGFGADALDAQETLAQSLGSPAPQARVTACIDIPSAEIAEALRLRVVVSGLPHPLRELRGRHGQQSLRLLRHNPKQKDKSQNNKKPHKVLREH